MSAIIEAERFKGCDSLSAQSPCQRGLRGKTLVCDIPGGMMGSLTVDKFKPHSRVLTKDPHLVLV